jgi:uncharacterized membrane protein YqgA involved in biofilm formation
MTLPRGSILNALTVFTGGLIGWLLSSRINVSYQQIAMNGLGIVTVGIGMKMLLGSKNILVVAAAIALGGMLGLALGIQDGIASFAEWIKMRLGLGDDARFVDTVIGTSVLFCVGPMTLLGCMQDRLEKKIDLLAIKSTMDGIGAIFFAAISGPAVMVVSVVVLVFQSLLTYSAKLLQPVAKDEFLLAEFSGAGGVMLIGTGLNLLEVKHLPVANYLPSLLLAPVFVWAGRKFSRRTKSPDDSP